MSELVKGVTEWRKVGNSLALIVSILTGLLIFLPDQPIRQAGLGAVKDQLLPYIGIIFFVAVAVFLAGSLELIAGLLKPEIADIVNHRRWSKVLHDLTSAEKALLGEFVNEGKTSVSAPLSDPVVSTLAAKRILVRTSNVGSPGSMNFPYTLQPWARKALRHKPKLLDQ